MISDHQILQKDVDVVVAGNMTENEMIIIYKKKFGKKNFNRVKNTIECQPRKGLRGWPSDEQLKEKITPLEGTYGIIMKQILNLITFFIFT